MSKNLHILFLLSYCGTALFGQNTDFAVEVAAFAEPVSDGYFKDIDNVYETLDANYIYRYYVDASSEIEANQKREAAMNIGFINARVINFQVLRASCKMTCQYVSPTRTGKTLSPFQSIIETYEVQALHCIFFDFDKSFIREDAIIELNKLLDVLQRHDNYQLQILAHTDARGSLEYNQALSRRRSLSTEVFLTKRGISSSRITKKLFGESAPIALNELSSGEDTEVGRQFNRRVEFVILDEAGTILGVVDKIRVPKKVQN
ncbi:MAG: outer membrane protein OmpA-like peptidoglycan-associated protein [Aureispira sp.]|jgi:outer membrane protein OmpA-like peptidoglycan-associated protein